MRILILVELEKQMANKALVAQKKWWNGYNNLQEIATTIQKAENLSSFLIVRRPDTICSWTVLTKTIKHEPSHLGDGLFMFPLRRKQENRLGNTMQNFIEVERFFFLLRRFCKVFTRYDKLNVTYFLYI